MDPARRRRPAGFTLVELLVTITVMAVLTLMSWRGLDGMLRAREQVQLRTDAVITLQTGLMQWMVDLDNLAETQQVSALDFDGVVVRLTRRDTSAARDAIRVVAWTRRTTETGGQWVRWQSAPFSTRNDLLNAWQKARQWGREPQPLDRQQDITLARIDQWQLFYYRNNAWSNPQSSAAADGIPQGSNPLVAIPDGVRLILTLSEGQALSGNLTRDWVNPTVGGGKS